jgi:hypothetical protein
MLSTHLGPSGDLAMWAVWLAVGLTAASFVMLVVEMRRRERGGVAIALTGLFAVVALLAAVVRPARVSARESVVGARVVVLADTSRSMALEQPGGRRWEARDKALEALSKASTSARLTVLGFGEGPPEPMPMTLNDRASEDLTTRGTRSDLATGASTIRRRTSRRRA